MRFSLQHVSALYLLSPATSVKTYNNGVYVRLVFNNPYAGELYLFFVTLLLFWFACVCGVCLCLSVNILCFSKQYNKHHMGHKRKNRETNDSI